MVAAALPMDLPADHAVPAHVPAEDLADRELVRRAQAGDKGAYDDLVRRYQERVYATMYHMTSNHEDASDLAQNEHVTVEAPVGAAVPGVKVPTEALVYGQNQAWAYVQRGPGRYERVAIDPARVLAGGYFLPGNEGVGAGQPMVVQGAGLLLARELNPSTEAEE